VEQLRVGHVAAIQALAYAPDGKALASASEDHTVRVWDLEARRLRQQFTLPEEVADVAWAPDGELLAATTSKETTVWEVGSGAKRRSFDHAGMTDRPVAFFGMRALAFAPDGQRLAVVERVWDLASGKEVCTCVGRHTGSLAYAPDGTALAT